MQVEVSFAKMQGLGNDFVVVDGLSVPLSLGPEQVRRLADRRLGVGCDQVLVIEPPARPDVDARCRIFNADGAEVEQCGNGVRCVARYLRDSGWVDKDAMVIETLGGVVHVACGMEGDVEVDMGPPRLAPEAIPMLMETQALRYELELQEGNIGVSALSMGNPHAVLCVPDVAAAPVARLGETLSKHWRFPQGANVGFMQVVDAAAVRLRVYERGVGETPACGSGACAAVVAGRLLGLLGEEVTVALPGGVLSIRWPGLGDGVWMRGPATRVFDARIRL
jgi:diaminopimelate epimerase